MPTALLFDLGGVLLRLEPDRTGQAFANLGAPGFMQVWRHDTPEKSLARLETGSIEAKQFRREVNAALGSKLSDRDFDAAFCAMLGDIAPSVLAWLAERSKERSLYLLSNNNVLHLSNIERRYPSLRKLFVKAYFSQEIQASKPAADAFVHAIEDAPLAAANTLFIDDSAANIDAAKSLGLQGLLLERNSDVIAAVDARLKHNAARP